MRARHLLPSPLNLDLNAIRNNSDEQPNRQACNNTDNTQSPGGCCQRANIQDSGSQRCDRHHDCQMNGKETAKQSWMTFAQ
jgi:hypothetical protein